jgi:hypothetical protein
MNYSRMIKRDALADEIEKAKRFWLWLRKEKKVPPWLAEDKDPWIGFVAELKLHQVCDELEIDHVWKPAVMQHWDFIFRGGVKLEVKCMGRHGVVEPLRSYSQGVNQLQAQATDCQFWMFASYNLNVDCVTLVGCSTHQMVLEMPEKKSGERIHEHCEVKKQKGGKIYNVQYDDLTAAGEWLEPFAPKRKIEAPQIPAYRKPAQGWLFP